MRTYFQLKRRTQKKLCIRALHLLDRVWRRSRDAHDRITRGASR